MIIHEEQWPAYILLPMLSLLTDDLAILDTREPAGMVLASCWCHGSTHHQDISIYVIDGLVQERRNSSVLAMELRFFLH